tara:strand:+ start:211 stop:870 length:660 start_codon:yes stop_codon:yes gene_type:complete
MLYHKVLCVVIVLVGILLFSQIYQHMSNLREPFVDLSIDMTIGDKLLNSKVSACGNVLPAHQYFFQRNHGRCLNPRTPEEVRSREGCMPVNIPSRETGGGFALTGTLEKIDKSAKGLDELPLYQRHKPHDFSKLLYYTTDNYREPLKFGVRVDGISCETDAGCAELRHGDVVEVPSLNGTYRVRRCSDKLASKSDKCVPKYWPNRYFTHKPPVLVGTEW